MKFAYQAIKIDGSRTSGEQEAADRYALAAELRAKGLTVVSVRSVAQDSEHRLLAVLESLRTIKMKDKIVFAGSLSSMLSAGLSLSRALNVIGRQTSSKFFKSIIEAVSGHINQGGTLSQGLALYPNVFPAVFIAMVQAGEESGNLPNALETIREQLAKSYELRRKIVGAMVYPAIIVLAIIAIGILMMVYLVPNLISLFGELKVDLPLSTRILIGVSNLFSNYGLWLGLAVILIIAALIKGYSTDSGRRLFAKAVMRLPYIGSMVRQYNSAVIMRTLSSLVSSGVSLIKSLEITGQVVANPFYKEAMTESLEQVQKGETLASIFEKQESLYPTLVTEMTAVGEETGNISGMLLKGAIFFEGEVDQATKNLSIIIEPALMIAVGIAVGFFAVSVIGPIYSLSSKL